VLSQIGQLQLISGELKIIWTHYISFG